jgi:hypothetical protein
MSVTSTEPTATELELSQALRDAVDVQIEAKRLNREDLADRLGVMPIAIDVLFARRRWPLPVGVRVASALGLDLRIDITPR